MKISLYHKFVALSCAVSIMVACFALAIDIKWYHAKNSDVYNMISAISAIILALTVIRVALTQRKYKYKISYTTSSEGEALTQTNSIIISLILIWYYRNKYPERYHIIFQKEEIKEKPDLRI